MRKCEATDLLVRVHGGEAAAVTGLSTLGSNVLNLLLGTFDGQLRKTNIAVGDFTG